MKKLIIPLLLLATTQAFAFSIGNSDTGTRVLLVSTSKDTDKISEDFEIESALKYGGQITLDFAKATELADKKNIKNVVGNVRCSDDPNNTTCVKTFPFIINTIGAYGWNYQVGGLGEIVFTKPFTND